MKKEFLGTELILGGARSGKSSLAESLAGESGLKVIYVATATAGIPPGLERSGSVI